MREPPRLDDNFYSDNFGSQPNLNQSSLARPPRRSSKGIFIAFGVTILAMLLVCSGFSVWLYTSLNVGSEMAADYREQRELANKPLPRSIVERLKSSTPQPVDANEDIQSVAEFLSADAQVYDSDADDFSDASIDYPRVVEEMQRTGMAKGVNRFTKFFWIENIKGAFELPDLGTHFEIIGFEWLTQDVEARVTVVAYYAWDDEPSVYLCYLTRASGDWKYYDARNILEPMSQAQYWAAYAGAPISTSDNFYELSNELYELNNADFEDEEKAQSSLLEYESRRYPSTMRPRAQSLTAEYLVIYNDAENLKKLCEKIDDQSFAGAHWIKGKLALLEEDKAAAFGSAGKLMDQVGWHPMAALLAAEAADSPAEKLEAAQWLAQSILLMPQHGVTVQKFFSVANDSQIQELMATLVNTANAPMRYVQLTQNVDLQQFSKLQDYAESNANLKTAMRYSSLLRLDASEEPQKTMAMAIELLDYPDLNELFPNFDSNSVEEFPVDNLAVVWSKLLSAVTDPGMLDTALAAVPDREEFTRRLRDRVLSNWYTAFNWPDVLRVLEELPEESELADEEETQAAIGVAQYRLERYEDAFANLFDFASEHRDEILDVDPPDYAYALMPALSKSAVETERVDELLAMLDEPEVAFVVTAATLAERPAYREQLQKLLAWIAGYAEKPQLWRHYYEADLAYSQGNWEVADREISQAIELADTDERLENYSLAGLLYDLAPFSEDVSEWKDLRVEMAIRCGRLPQLIAILKGEDDFQEDYLSILNYTIDVASFGQEPESVATIEQVIELLADCDNEYLQRSAAAKRSDLQKYGGDPIAALQSALAGCEKSTEKSYYGSACFNSAVKLIALTEQWTFIEELRAKASDQSEEASVDTLDALRDGEKIAFSDAIEGYEEPYRASIWTDDFELIEQLKKRDMWTTFNTKFAVDTVSLSYACSTHGIVLLGVKPGDSLAEIESAIRSVAGDRIERIAKDRFPNALDGWYADTEKGRIVAVVYESLAVDEQLPLVKKLKESSQGILALALISPKGALASKTMRELVIELGQELDSAKGYIDYQSDSWFLDEDGSSWRDQLSAAVEHGVNRRSPKVDYFPWHAIDQATQVPEERLRIQVGVILEDIPVEVFEAEASQGESANPSSLLKDSPILFPFLSTGDRVE